MQPMKAIGTMDNKNNWNSLFMFFFYLILQFAYKDSANRRQYKKTRIFFAKVMVSFS